MKKQIVINASKDRSRIAIVEDGELVELYVENPDNVRTIGNIYLGRIQKVMPAIRAAFVDVGQKQDCFLHFSDLTDNFPQLLAVAGEDVPGLDEPVLSLAPAKRVADDEDEPDVEETLEVEPSEEESKTRRSRGRRSRGRGRGRGRGKGRREEEEEQEETPKRLPGVIDLTSSPLKASAPKPEPSEAQDEAEADDASSKRRSRSKPSRKEESAEESNDDQPTGRDTSTGDANGQRDAAATSDDAETGETKKKRGRRRRGRRGRGGSSGEAQADDAQDDSNGDDSETPAKETKRKSRSSRTSSSDKKKDSTKGDTSGDDADDRETSSKRLPSSIDLTSSSRPSPAKEATSDEDDQQDETEGRRSRSRRRSKSDSDGRSDAKGSDQKDSDNKPSGRRRKSSQSDEDGSRAGRRSRDTSGKDDSDSRRGGRRRSDSKKEGSDRDSSKDDSNNRGGGRSSGGRSSSRGSSRGGSGRSGSSSGKIPPSEQLLRRDGRIIVKITKEPISTKGPRVSTDLSLAGRFLVLVPAADYVAVSKKIESAKERRRLRTLASSLKPDGFGVIVRTVAEGRDAKSLDQDLRLLTDKWRKMEKKLKEKPEPPVLLYEDVNMVSSVIRDLFSDDYDRILVDDPKVFRNVQAYVKAVAPQMADKVEMHKGRTSAFRSVGIERQVEEAFSKRVNMKGGGYLYIETTEAMHVVDVNSGRAGRGKSQKQNLIDVNVEAAREVAKQLRLRDLGGIIVVDFIDLRYDRDRKKVTDALKEAFARDRAVTKLLPMSDFGLVQITRQRLRPSITTQAADDDGEPLDAAEAAAAAGAGEIRHRGRRHEPEPEPEDRDGGRDSPRDEVSERPTIAPEDATPQALSGRLRGWLDHYRRTVDERYKGRPIVVRVHPLFGAYLRRGFPSPLTRWRLALRGIAFHLEEDATVDPLAFDVRDQKSGRSLLKKYAA